MDVSRSMGPAERDSWGRAEVSPGLGAGPWQNTVDCFDGAEEACRLPGAPGASGEVEAGRPRARNSWAAGLERYLWREGEAGSSSRGFPVGSPGPAWESRSAARPARGSGPGEGPLLLALTGRGLGGV